MSVQVFKDGKSELVEPDALEGCLLNGWSVVDPDAPLPSGITIINQKAPGEHPYVIDR